MTLTPEQHQQYRDARARRDALRERAELDAPEREELARLESEIETYEVRLGAHLEAER